MSFFIVWIKKALNSSFDLQYTLSDMLRIPFSFFLFKKKNRGLMF